MDIMSQKQEKDSEEYKEKNKKIISKLIKHEEIKKYIESDTPLVYSPEMEELDKLKITTLKDMVETAQIS